MKSGFSYFICFVLILAIFGACQEAADKKIAVETQALPSSLQAYPRFDSASLEKIITQNKYRDSISDRLRRFYGNRNYQFAWFINNGLAEQANNFWNAQSNYIAFIRDSSLYNPLLQQMMDTISKDVSFADTAKLNVEIALTVHFFRFARRAYQGNIRLGERDLDWFIPRKRIEMTDLLDSMIQHKGENMAAYEPVNRQYQLLKQKLLAHYQMAEAGGWPSIETKEKKLEKGDSAQAIVALKKRLHTTGDFLSNDSSREFTLSLEEAVKKFQRRYGLKEDGIIGGSSLKYLNEPVDVRIRQILVNMERMRWIPAEPSGDFILVNIPQYKLIVYENGKRKFEMNIVAGSSQHQTVIFTGDMKYVVFSPYWNVPPSIIKKEIVPGMRRNPNYLQRHNMEWNGGAVRQKPGPNNSLGLVKFLFPNNYNIYLHDTPSKSLFDEPKRAFSHGCIRVSDPKKLAEWALRNQPEWNENKIVRAMNTGKEKYVTLTSTIPVFLGYFTAWVDEEGNLNFRDDIYGHDKKLADHLFNQVN
jgi:L,D-transpeptidase YcbB